MPKKFHQSSQIEVRTVPHHLCALTPNNTPVVSKIYEGFCVPWRRRFWKCITINPLDLSVKTFLKSSSQIDDEEVRHLENHPWTIYPFSKFRYYWELFMSVVWFIEFVTVPLTLSDVQLFRGFWCVKNIVDGLCFVDVFLWFFTGYYENLSQVVVLSLGKIARRYLCGYFLIDVVSSLPFEYASRVYERPDLHPLAALQLLKILRLPTFFRYVTKWQLQRNSSWSFHDKIFRTFMVMVLLLTWSTSALYMTQTYVNPEALLEQKTKWETMTVLAFKVTKLLMVVGTTDRINTSNSWMLLEVFFIMLGSVLRIILLGKNIKKILRLKWYLSGLVVQFQKKRSSTRNKYNHRLQQVREYIKYKELPVYLRNKTLHYVNFKSRNHVFREEEVFNTLSSVLQNDILLERCQRMVKKVDFFKDIPADLLVRIVVNLRSEIFLPNDIIVMADSAGHAMYFIYTGAVAIFTAHGKEICHLDDGAHFGEIALLLNEPRVATVIAVKECEVFKLSRKDFQEAIEPYPELYTKIKLLATARLEKTLEIMAENKETRNVTVGSKSSDFISIET